MGATGRPKSFLDSPLRELLDRVADAKPTPGGGSTAAIVTALAAGLVAKAARCSREDWDEAGGIVAQAEALRARATPLAQADAEAYEAALAVLESQVEPTGDERDAVIADVLSRAADVPLVIAETATDVAELGAHVAEVGNQSLSGDAAAAVVLAEAAARAAANLVRVNLATREGDDRIVRADRLCEVARGAARRALTVPA